MTVVEPTGTNFYAGRGLWCEIEPCVLDVVLRMLDESSNGTAYVTLRVPGPLFVSVAAVDQAAEQLAILGYVATTGVTGDQAWLNVVVVYVPNQHPSGVTG